MRQIANVGKFATRGSSADVELAKPDRNPKIVGMWFPPPKKALFWTEAETHLKRVDPKMADLIDRLGPCTLRPRRDYFVVLCKSIFSQQISTTVAATLFARFADLFPMRRPTPGLVLQALDGQDESVLKHCGLSRQKAAYLRDLATHFANGTAPTKRFSRMDDEAIIDALVAVKGIGRWTAEMFLMFTLNRPDVLPVDDLGLRQGVREMYELPERPTAKELTALGEPWRPWRSIATWYVWRRFDAPEKKPPATKKAPSSRAGRKSASKR